MIRIQQDEEEEARRRRRGEPRVVEKLAISNDAEDSPFQIGVKTIALAMLTGMGLGIGFYIVQKKMRMS